MRSWRSTGTVLGMVLDAPVVVQQQVPWLGRAMLGSTMDTCYAPSWVAFGRIFDFLHEGVDSAPELDSRPALLLSGRHIADNGSAWSILVLLVLTHLALCSHDCRQFSEKCTVVAHEMHLEICTLFLRASCIFQRVQRSNFCASRFFWSPRALTPVSARGLGEERRRGTGVAGSCDSQVTRYR